MSLSIDSNQYKNYSPSIQSSTNKSNRKWYQIKWTTTTIIVAIIIFLIVSIIALVCYFYRKPKTILHLNEPYKVYSPAYGKIMKITKREDDTLFIAIFLNPFDIHYQYIPISGQVQTQTHDHNGNFYLAYELNKSSQNEKSITTIQNQFGLFTIYQIAGYLVRRIDTYVKPQQQVTSGECMGLIHFGSRVDIIIPNASKFTCFVKENERVKASRSVLGEYKKKEITNI